MVMVIFSLLGIGDDTRLWGPPFTNGHSYYFISINRNKKVNALQFLYYTALVFFEKYRRLACLITVSFIIFQSLAVNMTKPSGREIICEVLLCTELYFRMETLKILFFR